MTETDFLIALVAIILLVLTSMAAVEGWRIALGAIRDLRLRSEWRDVAQEADRDRQSRGW